MTKKRSVILEAANCSIHLSFNSFPSNKTSWERTHYLANASNRGRTGTAGISFPHLPQSPHHLHRCDRRAADATVPAALPSQPSSSCLLSLSRTSRLPCTARVMIVLRSSPRSRGEEGKGAPNQPTNEPGQSPFRGSSNGVATAMHWRMLMHFPPESPNMSERSHGHRRHHHRHHRQQCWVRR